MLCDALTSAASGAITFFWPPEVPTSVYASLPSLIGGGGRVATIVSNRAAGGNRQGARPVGVCVGRVG